MLASERSANGWRCMAWMRDSSEALLRFLLVTSLAYDSSALEKEVASASLRLTNTPASISRSIIVAQVFASAWVLNVRVCWGHPLRLIWACHWYGPFFLNVAIFNRTVPKLCHQSYRSTHGSRKTPANTGNLPRRAFAVQLHDNR